MEEPKEDKENDTQKMNRNGNPNVPRWWPVLSCTESDREVRDHCGFVYTEGQMRPTQRQRTSAATGHGMLLLSNSSSSNIGNNDKKKKM